MEKGKMPIQNGKPLKKQLHAQQMRVAEASEYISRGNSPAIRETGALS